MKAIPLALMSVVAMCIALVPAQAATMTLYERNTFNVYGIVGEMEGAAVNRVYATYSVRCYDLGSEDYCWGMFWGYIYTRDGQKLQWMKYIHTEDVDIANRIVSLDFTDNSRYEYTLYKPEGSSGPTLRNTVESMVLDIPDGRFYSTGGYPDFDVSP